MSNSELLFEVEQAAAKLFEKLDTQVYTYHNFIHTKAVVNRAKIIGESIGLNDNQLTICLVAAWFHDVGYLYNHHEHESVSIQLITDFLQEKSVDKLVVEQIVGCIAATKFPQHPNSLLEEVICDADMSHLAHPDFFEISLLLRKECKNLNKCTLSKYDYWLETKNVFEKHVYFTEYGKKVLAEGKQKNFELLKERLVKQKLKEEKKLRNGLEMLRIQEKWNESPHELHAANLTDDDSRNIFETLQDEIKTPTRGIETMFRIAGRNQMNLSSIADNKSNILISVNALLISVVGSTSLIHYTENPAYMIPAIVFIITCLLTFILAILATRPIVTSGKFTRDDIKNRKVNLLFFGNFYKMTGQEYEIAMIDMLKDYNYLYHSLINDQYSLGKVLGKKYRYLHYAYNIFMYGLILSVVVFVFTVLVIL